MSLMRSMNVSILSSWVKLHIPVTSAGLNLYPFTVITLAMSITAFLSPMILSENH